MKLERLPYDPQSVAGFFEQGLTALGALWERTWHDRMEVVAEGSAAALWGAESKVHAGEIHFAPGDTASARDAATQVFPGCPLTFRLAEALRPQPLALERLVLFQDSRPPPPTAELAERRWRAQFPETRIWRQSAAFTSHFHFSLLALARCEIQAIDQHWSLHRIAMSLTDGTLDNDLAAGMDFVLKASEPDMAVSWPALDLKRWHQLLQMAIHADLGSTLSAIETRQQIGLERELNRIDAYFAAYIKELETRALRTRSTSGSLKAADRIAATQAEHARRRQDQIDRHVIRVHPHIDALLMIAEPSWRCEILLEEARQRSTVQADYLPRTRAWMVQDHR